MKWMKGGTVKRRKERMRERERNRWMERGKARSENDLKVKREKETT